MLAMSDPSSPQGPSSGRPDPDGSDPYGSDPYGANPYGAARYAPDASGPDRDAVPDRRPRTVLAAGLLTLVVSGLVAVLFGFLAVALVVGRPTVTDEIEQMLADDPELGSVSPGAVATGLLVVVVVFLLWSLLACVLAVLALRRRGWARVLLIVSASVTALLSLLSILSVVSVLPLLASVAVVVLLLTGGAGPWYAGRRSAR